MSNQTTPVRAFPAPAKEAATGRAKTYLTRYGVMTPEDAAQDLLDRATNRLIFLRTVFDALCCDGESTTLGGSYGCGLAAILQDIAHDVNESRYYYYGVMQGERWNPEPGNLDDERTEVRP